MLKLHFKDSRHPPLWVVEKLYSIGSSPENHLALVSEGVDPHHAKLIQENHRYFLKDNNSTSGSFINGQRVTQKEILPGDVIKLGSAEIIVLDPRSLAEKNADKSAVERSKDTPATPWRLISESSLLAGKHFAINPDRSTVIGRGNQCDIVIPGTHLSRQHTEITIEGNHLRIRDLGSANGTYLNELRVDNATANNGDRLRLDVYSFRIVAPDLEETKIRIRKPMDELAKPVERKQVSDQPKRWKTRPTSPGNRIEPAIQSDRRILWFALAVTVAIGCALIAYALW